MKKIFKILIICFIFSFYFSNIAFAKIETIDIHKAESLKNKTFTVNENKFDNNKIKNFSFSKTKNMNFKHIDHIAILLPNNQILIRDKYTAEIYDPEKNEYIKLQKQEFIDTYNQKNAKVMSDQKVLIFSDIYPELRMEVFDYKTQQFEKFNPQLPYGLKRTDEIKDIKAYILSSELLLFKFNTEYYLYNYNINNYKQLNWNENDLGNDIIFCDDQIIITTSTQNRLILHILKYNELDKNIELIKKVKTPEFLGSNIVKSNNEIFFFTGSTRTDSIKKRKGMHYSSIYKFNLKTKFFEKEGVLSNGANKQGLLLKDGRILFNSGQFEGEHIYLETYDPKTKTSSFSDKHPWYRHSTMTLLDDGRVLFTGGYIFHHEAIYGTKNSFIYNPLQRKKYKLKEKLDEKNNIKWNIQ